MSTGHQQNIDLTSPARLSALFQRYGFRWKKRYGQNFLVDRNVLSKILEAADIHKGDCVLEIGAGAGTLSQAIAEIGANVVAVEIDRQLLPILQEVLSPYPNAKIVNTNFLTINPTEFLSKQFGDVRIKIIGNLPYYITSPILTALLETSEIWECAVLMVQKEVAARLKASPGTPDYSSLSIYTQFHAHVELIAYVSKNVFLPPPEVSSAIVKLTSLSAPPVDTPSKSLFFDVVHCAFGQKRKTLLNSLSGCQALGLSKEEVARILSKANIEPSRRAETLSIEEFAYIANIIFHEPAPP